jgi:hypothetical protein
MTLPSTGAAPLARWAAVTCTGTAPSAISAVVTSTGPD